MLFARSRARRMHFKNQCTLIARKKVVSSKSRRLPSVEGLFHRAESRKSHRSDTDSRLLTEMKPRNFRAWDLAGAVAPHVQPLFQ
jgi:hypothetical protein